MQGFSMKDYIEERAVEIAYYIIENKATVRQTAKKMCIRDSIHICKFYLKALNFSW